MDSTGNLSGTQEPVAASAVASATPNFEDLPEYFNTIVTTVCGGCYQNINPEVRMVDSLTARFATILMTFRSYDKMHVYQ